MLLSNNEMHKACAIPFNCAKWSDELQRRYQSVHAIPFTNIELPVTTNLLSIERADWLKLHDMFKVRDAKCRQRLFPVGFPFRVRALNLSIINIFHDAVAVRIESRCVIKAKHVLLVGVLIRSIFRWKKMHSPWSARTIFPTKNRTN